MATSEATVKVRVDLSEFHEAVNEAVDNLPDEILDRLATKIERKLLERQRRQGR
jgi:predicted Zn-dependent protease with MMP-like domain